MHHQPAGLLLRTLAFIIDTLVVWIPLTLFLIFVTNSQTLPELSLALSSYLILVVIPVVFSTFWYTVPLVNLYNATLGKLITGLRVVNENGEKLTLKQNLFRHTIGYQFARMLFGFGFGSIIWDKNKQGWHDHAIGSQVIEVNKMWPLALGVLIMLIMLHIYLITASFQQLTSGPLPDQVNALINAYRQEQEQKNSQPEDVESPLMQQDEFYPYGID